MDYPKAREFVKELAVLQEKYGIRLEAGYEEEIDYDYDEVSYVSGVTSYLVLVDKDGFDIPLHDLESETLVCRYCGRIVDTDRLYCHEGCKEKDEKVQAKRSSQL